MRANFRSLLAVLFASTLWACGDGSTETDAPVEPADAPGELGSFRVGYLSLTVVDPSRNDREIPVDLWYPVDEPDAEGVPRAAYPLLGEIALDSDVALAAPPVSARLDQTLIVFSHGFGGISKASIELMEVLASHGFIVASPEHTGNSQFSGGDSFDEAAANRVPDVSILIDAMTARSRSAGDAFFDRVRPDGVGVIGHSFGGMTALGVAAGWAGAPPDPRVAAIVPISAVVDRELQSDDREGPNAGFTQEQLATISVPVMLVGGTEDVNVFIENNAIAFEQITNAPRVYQVDIIGANHTHFANVCVLGDLLIDLGIGPDLWPNLGATGLIQPYEDTCGPDAFPITEANRLQNLYAVSFFRRHLLDEEEYEQFLAADYAETEPAVTLSLK